MGFDELWDGFDKIKDRTEDGEKFTACIQKYLTKRHEIETKYAKSLSHLNECFKTDIEIGTTLACWNGLRDETQSLGDAHQAFCNQIQELLDTIANNLKEEKKNRAMLVAKGTKLVSELAKTEDAMKRARLKYVDARKKQDKAQEAVQKAKLAGNAAGKVQKNAEKEEKRADKADNEYRISVNTLKVAQDKFHDVDMPALLREFELHEEKRLQVTREYFLTFADKQSPLGPHWTGSTDRFIVKTKEINIRSDLDLYVEKNRPDSDQPPPRAQYISYDGSVVQEVQGGGAGGSASAAAAVTTKKKKPSLLPGTKKKKETPVAGEKPEKKLSISPNPPPPSTAPPAPGSHPATLPPSDTPLPPGMAAATASGGPTDEDASLSEVDERPSESNATMVPIEVVTVYAYDATEPNELSFVEGETLFLLEKDDSGWWRGRNQKGQEGLFPSNFVEVVGEGPAAMAHDINADYQALYDYEAEEEAELTIKEGEILHVISETDGWYYGTNEHGQSGNFPSNFVEPIPGPNSNT